MTKTIQVSTLQFPEIQLHTSDAHKLRGYFGNLFREHSSLLHNHFEDGSSMYRYPLVQYKVVRKVPTLVGLEEGARLLVELFLQIKELKIGEMTYPVLHKNFKSHEYEIGVSSRLQQYRFDTLWMALNQKNYETYLHVDRDAKQELLRKVFTANCLSFFKAFEYWAKDQIMVFLEVEENSTQFKNQKMQAFQGRITTNVLLPDFVGLGKSVARGFGTIRRV